MKSDKVNKAYIMNTFCLTMHAKDAILLHLLGIIMTETHVKFQRSVEDFPRKGEKEQKQINYT